MLLILIFDQPVRSGFLEISGKSKYMQTDGYPSFHYNKYKFLWRQMAATWRTVLMSVFYVLKIQLRSIKSKWKEIYNGHRKEPKYIFRKINTFFHNLKPSLSFHYEKLN